MISCNNLYPKALHTPPYQISSLAVGSASHGAGERYGRPPFEPLHCPDPSTIAALEEVYNFYIFLFTVFDLFLYTLCVILIDLIVWLQILNSSIYFWEQEVFTN